MSSQEFSVDPYYQSLGKNWKSTLLISRQRRFTGGSSTSTVVTVLPPILLVFSGSSTADPVLCFSSQPYHPSSLTWSSKGIQQHILLSQWFTSIRNTHSNKPSTQPTRKREIFKGYKLCAGWFWPYGRSLTLFPWTMFWWVEDLLPSLKRQWGMQHQGSGMKIGSTYNLVDEGWRRMQCERVDKRTSKYFGRFSHRDGTETEKLIEKYWGQENCHFT